MIKKKYKIEGMHCVSCAMVIDGDLEEVNGIKSARTNFARSELEVEYEEDLVSEEKIRETVEKAGYKIAF